MDTYAHTQDKPRLELTEKIEANFYSQDLTPAAPQPRQNEKPAATKISGKEILFLCKGKQAVQTLRRKAPDSGKCANGVQKVCSRFPT